MMNKVDKVLRRIQHIGNDIYAVSAELRNRIEDEEEFEDLLKDLSVLRDELTKQYAKLKKEVL